MATRKRQGRIEQILELLQRGRTASIQELSLRLSVSEMTIRRDLMLLAAQNKVHLVRAGALLRSESPGGFVGFSLTTDGGVHAEEKMRIGQKAATLVEPGDVIIVDSGSTTEWLARSLSREASLTVICFALNILLEVGTRPKCTVILAGGTLRPDTRVFESSEAVQLVRRFRAHKAFLSAGGVSEPLGVTCADPAEAELKKASIESAQSRILLADSSKLARVTGSWFASLSDFDAMVTDSGISLEFVEIARSRGIALHVT
ncbi:MAG TPA: DeoR/GlpR family DNA-binding transcription regulator [Spirochaetia bacterium]|nr:DeoR/GlpR family DNA-binding transcription regulator [Spirochaetia bacterium]